MAWDMSQEIRMVTVRCFDCGRFYAHEMARIATCPVCAYQKIRTAEQRADTAERSKASIRGAMKRLKVKHAKNVELWRQALEGE